MDTIKTMRVLEINNIINPWTGDSTRSGYYKDRYQADLIICDGKVLKIAMGKHLKKLIL